MQNRKWAVLWGALTAMAASAALTQAIPTHVRGKVKSLTGDVLVVQGPHGVVQTVKLAPDWAVVVMKPVDVASIQPGSFIGTTEFEKPDGTGRSLEVHVFPPGVKMGEGHYPWDLKPHSMMTNGTVGKVTASGKGADALDVAYPGGVASHPGAGQRAGGDHLGRRAADAEKGRGGVHRPQQAG